MRAIRGREEEVAIIQDSMRSLAAAVILQALKDIEKVSDGGVSTVARIAIVQDAKDFLTVDSDRLRTWCAIAQVPYESVIKEGRKRCRLLSRSLTGLRERGL